MKTIELEDIQGFVLRGYKRMNFASYIMLKTTNPVATKKWINAITPEITNGTHHPKTNCLNIAFTNNGLYALGLEGENMGNFITPFREGIAEPHRTRLLGDDGDSAPETWTWGGPKNEKVHIMLMVFGGTQELLDTYSKKQVGLFGAAGLEIISVQNGQVLDENKEHFGFTDGIGQPIIAGAGRGGDPDNTVATGEFLMGYKNGYDVYPDTPLITKEQGDMNLLPTDAAGSGHKDLGRNGSYLVFRQLKQDVDAFWKFMNERTKNADGSLNAEESIKTASKMIGRWPSGAPLTLHPDKDPGGMSNEDKFSYAAHDKDGTKCPFGSHLRRVNPRDVFEDNGPKQSLKLTNKHRIIRRARLYGKPIAGSPTNHNPEGEVGLHFMCFQADIGRQFEFLMHTWANYPNFQELYNDPDPIIGVKQNVANQNFTIQAKPANKCVENLQRFVTVRGGGYFFFPSVMAIRYIASL